MTPGISQSQPLHPTQYVVHAFQYPPARPPHTLREVSTPRLIKRRDAIVWRLLEFEHDLPAHSLELYWDILDMMMDISVSSALEILQEAYCARFRKLRLYETRQYYPGVRQAVYRLAYFDRTKPYEDFSSGALVELALDVLQEQAYILLQT